MQMMNKLVEKKVFSLEDTIDKFFNDDHPPAFKMKNPYSRTPNDLAHVTMHMLSTHTSGLPRGKKHPFH
jgi:CubicO group peptidase (beta-lactamase class C family)